jgi:hypothetical protein
MIITDHESSEQTIANIQDVLVYDIPTNWTTQYLLQCLHLWKKIILIYKKHQKKYFTVRVKIKMKNTARHTFNRES